MHSSSQYDKLFHSLCLCQTNHIVLFLHMKVSFVQLDSHREHVTNLLYLMSGISVILAHIAASKKRKKCLQSDKKTK